MAYTSLIFRADGNTEIGMGHFVRSLALAAMLKDDFTCTFAVSNPSERQLASIAEAGCRAWELPRGQEHFAVFLNGLAGDEMVVLDNYFFDTAYQQAIVAKGCRLVCIDDTYDRAFASHAVINHAPGVQASHYTVMNGNVHFCLGPAYALLRPEFMEEARKEPKYTPGSACFICFGGADKYGLALTALQAVADLDTVSTAHVVLGNAPRLKAQVQDEAEILEDSGLLQVHTYESLGPSEMLGVMKQCQMAILPASSIMYEVMCVGMPIFGGYYVDNQKRVYEGFLQDQTIFGVGNYHNYTPSMLASTIASSRMTEWAASQVAKQHQAIDGGSRERFRELFGTLR